MSSASRHIALRRALPALMAAAGACAALSASAPAAQAARTSSFFGVAPATATNEREMHRLADGGAGTLRFTLSWRAVQPRPNGPYEWLAVDDFVMTAARNGITPLPTLIGSPSYAAPDPFRPPLDSPIARQRWQQFARAAVRRYGTTGPGSLWRGARNCARRFLCAPDLPIRPIRTWQIWNEPNMKLFWKPLPNVAEYADLLRLTGDAIHSVDPGARLLTGGITPGGGRYGPKGTEFLAALYRSAPDAARLFTGVAFHPYAEYPAEVVSIVEEMRATMNAHGDASGGLFVSESGWATQGPPGKLVVTESEQADRLGEVMTTLSRRRARYGLMGMLAYTDHDFRDPSLSCKWCPSAGLMRIDGSAKPAWQRFAAIARATSASPTKLVSNLSSTDPVKNVGRRGRTRKTKARVTSTVERYSDGAAIVDSTSDDLPLTRGRWKVASCLRYLAGARPAKGDHVVCDREKLRIKSRRKAIAPVDHLVTLERAQLAAEPYSSRPRVIAYVEARKRKRGRWRPRLTSLRKRSAWISLRDAAKRR